MNVFKFFEELVSSDLSKIAHRKILDKIRAEYKIPQCTTLIPVGTPIFRGRSEENVESFNSEFEISYRTDYGNITEYGRANRPYQSVFYGSIPTSAQDYAPVTTIAETVREFFDPLQDCKKEFITIGMWKTTKEIEVLDVCFSDDHLQNDYFLGKQKLWKDKLEKEFNDPKLVFQLLRMLSKEYSKHSINSHWDYKVSSVYFDLGLEQNLKGVIYPSVRRKFEGYNLAIPPVVVDNCLELHSAIVCHLGDKITPVKSTTELGFMNSKFNWTSIK